MFSSIDLRANLKALDALFAAETDQRKARLFARLAVLELCGWTEEAVDALVVDSANRCLKTMQHQKDVQEHLKRLYGFDYLYHFKPMLARVIGLYGFEHVEARLSTKRPSALPKLQAALSQLRPVRDSIAHTHSTATVTVPAPSLVISLTRDIELGLKLLSSEMRSSGY
jgi:hypothetical protein